MLDTATKKRIDDCRDILVGKLPDPKAQIEQITIALIYKFMDDMDKEAIDLGGKAKFFTDYKIPSPEFPKDRKKDSIVPFSQYSWDNLFNTKVTAAEMLRLYSEAIAGMDKNPNIPQLFRDIFKNAFLPYRDPETLKLFLKTIGEFEYTHSEKLGDAFEYLLSVMGSQGDAGQFRTPRHIIDFVTAIVNPGKTDKILDPACGTAGFLISAFKHIKSGGGIGRDATHGVSTNTKPLTPDEQKRMIQNFTGYDISPDMVRLSLVNLYLHGFSDPHIWEYDTLSSEERWDETFDVILANPPFMSPKGGIRPHKKFSIASNRSEVLFVDYIAEHLNPKGRAGIIVPEGVIFQSGTAYKELRKMLVENYLYAVVSLPAGVFNPYSGVKTSVLLLDKALAKTKDDILFVKIENDGYSLGAQRTEIKGSQLEEAVKIIHDFVTAGRDAMHGVSAPAIAHAVTKNEIAKNGDYNLSGERYKEQKIINSDWPLIELKQVCSVLNGYAFKANLFNESKIGTPIIRIRDINTGFSETYYDGQYEEKYVVSDGDLLIGMDGDFKATLWKNGKALLNQRVCKITDFKNVKKEFVYHLVQQKLDEIHGKTFAVTVKHLSSKQIEAIQIPLPPLSIQQEIVTEIEGWQKIIDGAKAVLENYKPTIDINPDWEMVELGEVCEKITKGSSPRWQGVKYESSGVLFVTSENVGIGKLLLENKKYVEEKFNEIEKKSILQKGDVLTNIVGASIGRTAIFDLDEIANINQAVCIIRCKLKRLNNIFLMWLLNSDYLLKTLHDNKVDNARANLSLGFFEKLSIPLPPLATQRQIVSQIEKEQALVNANKQLIEIFEQKIKDRIAKVWGSNKAEPLAYGVNDMLTMAAEG